MCVRWVRPSGFAPRNVRRFAVAKAVIGGYPDAIGAVNPNMKHPIPNSPTRTIRIEPRIEEPTTTPADQTPPRSEGIEEPDRHREDRLPGGDPER